MTSTTSAEGIMHQDLNKLLGNAAVRFTNLVEDNRKLAADIRAEAEARIERMISPTQQTVDQIRRKAAADAERAEALAEDYLRLAEGANGGQFDVPRALYGDHEFATEF